MCVYIYIYYLYKTVYILLCSEKINDVFDYITCTFIYFFSFIYIMSIDCSCEGNRCTPIYNPTECYKECRENHDRGTVRNI